MDKLYLDDYEAEQLISILKLVLKKYNVILSPGNKGELQLVSHDYSSEFIINFYTPKHRSDKISIHLREKETNLSLIRINIDELSFHLNSNGEKINGNRILVFSSEEWKHKNDGKTHTIAYPLPKEFRNTSNLEQVFLDFLVYINVKQEEKITFPSLL